MTYRTHDQVASEFIAEGKRRNITERGIVICIATGLVESGLTVFANTKLPDSLALPHDAVGSDGYSVGPLQQQVRNTGNGWWWGDVATCMDPTRSAGLFYDRLAKKNYDAATTDSAAGAIAQSIQGSAFPDRYQQRMPDARSIYARLAKSSDPSVSQETPVVASDPFTGAMWSPNRYHPRGQGFPRWIAVHTQEGGRTAHDLAAFLDDPASQVSYHAVNDDRELLKVVAEIDAPWSAAGANSYAFHICLAGSYAAWSRGKWLETDASDGKNEDVELTNAARIIAWWCQKYGIPAEYIGGNGIPWGRDGICGHMDFGTWGGGHHDPGPNFPWEELIRRVKAFLAGSTPVVLPPPVPVGPGGGTPVDPASSQYFAGILAQGSEGPQVSELQRRLHNAFASFAGQLPVDGDFGPLTYAAVREFQRRSGLTVDGIVGPQTATALKLKTV